jgi:hypothetical protein
MNGDAHIHLERERRPWWSLGLVVQIEKTTVVFPEGVGVGYEEVLDLADGFEKEGYEVTVDFT